MDHAYAIIEKIFFVVLLIAAGIFAKKMKWVSDEGEKDLSRLSVDFIWPAMIFSSIVTTLTARDILSNLALPVLAAVMHLTGFLIGSAVCRLAGYAGEQKKMFLFHATMNNFLGMALPLTLFFLPEKGAALLAVANLGSIIVMWTLCVAILAGNTGIRAAVKNICSPAMFAIVAGVACVLLDAGALIPRLVVDVLTTIGGPTLFIGLFIAGTQICRLGSRALRFNGWNVLTGLLRIVLIPGVLFGLGFFLRDFLSREALIIFLVSSITPANVTSVILAMKFGSSAELAAEGVVFTHVFGIASMVGFIMLIERFFL
jgi:predicted permease